MNLYYNYKKKKMFDFIRPEMAAWAIIISLICAAESASDILRFDFGAGAVASGYTQILPTDVYRAELGYGFEPQADVKAIDRGGNDALKGDFVTSDKPFLFSIKLPEGNYKLTMTLGDGQGESTTTVKAELRRLMLENVKTAFGQYLHPSIAVNIRTPEIAEGRRVRLKDREKTSEVIAWDDKLTLEFNGTRPCLCALEIERMDHIPTGYLLGDSTVCDQPFEPWNSWGQMLPRFFTSEVAVANHAQSGESIRSSLSAGRFDKVWSIIKSGDYLFIQFGHNDMKDTSPEALSIYKSNIYKIIAQTKKRGAIPVLITSMERKSGIETDTLAGYPAAMREIAAQTQSPLIDLHSVSKVLYKALGPNLDMAFQDGTHHTSYGSYQLAKCVVQGIRDNKLKLAQYITDDFQEYNPAIPDPYENFSVPPSPMYSANKPLGS